MKALVDLIKKFEGCRLTAYKCPAGVWTIGWGSTGPEIKEGLVWTQSQADERLQRDADKVLADVLNASPILRDKPNKAAAIADFAYNLGIGAYRNSTLRKRVDAGLWPEAAQELLKWVNAKGKKLPGLVARREAEVKLLLA